MRVHTDSATTAAIGAKAYTAGNDIVVHPKHGGTGADRDALLVHEAVHVVQQRSGTVYGRDLGDGLKVSDPGDRFEQEAERISTDVLPRPGAKENAHAERPLSAAGGPPVLQRAVLDEGVSINQAADAIEAIEVPPRKKKGFFAKVGSKIRSLFGASPKRDASTEMQENKSWAVQQLRGRGDPMMPSAADMAADLRRTLAAEPLGPPGSARKSFADQSLRKLAAIKTRLLAVEEELGSKPAITSALSAIAKDQAAIEQLTSPVDPEGVTTETSWMEAIRATEIKGHVDAIKKQMSEDVAKDPSMGTLLRGNEAGTKPAWEFARSLLAAESDQAIGVELGFTAAHQRPIEDDFPGYNGRMDQPTPTGFKDMVQELLHQFSDIFLPPGAGYVQGDIMKMLVPLYTHLRESAGGGDISQPMSVVVANTLFLRGLTTSLTIPLGSIPAEQTGRTAAMRAIQILTSAINRTGDYTQKLSPDFWGDVEDTGRLAESFLGTVVTKLAMEAAHQKTLKTYAEIGTGS